MCMQEAANREECRAFDDLKDEKAVAEAVKSGEQAIFSLSLLCTLHFQQNVSPVDFFTCAKLKNIYFWMLNANGHKWS